MILKVFSNINNFMIIYGYNICNSHVFLPKRPVWMLTGKETRLFVVIKSCLAQNTQQGCSTCRWNSLQRSHGGAEAGVPSPNPQGWQVFRSAQPHSVQLAGFLGDLYSAVNARGDVQRSFIQFTELQPACGGGFVLPF